MKARKPRLIKIGKYCVAALSGLRFFLSPVAIFCMILALAACDLSWIAGKPSSSSAPTSTTGTSGGGGSTTTPSLISSFAFQASKNASLTTDEVATITAPNVYITVPYSVIQNQTSLTPTVTLQTGYALTNPSGAFVPTDGMTLVITQTSNSTISNYTLHVSVDPGSIAFLQLANPFYYDSSGTKNVLTSSQYTLSLAGATNAYTIDFITDAFSIAYNVNVIQNVITSRNIGFSSASVPYGSFTTNLSSALGGAICPYTVTVQSPSKNVTNNFTVSATRTKSNVVQLTDISATVGYIYTYTTTQTFADSTLSNYLGAQFSAQGGDAITSTNNSDNLPEGDTQQAFNNVLNDQPPNLTNTQVFLTSAQRYNEGGGWDFLTQTPQSQVNANNSAVNIAKQLPSPVNGSISTGSTTIDCGTNFTITSTGLLSPPPISPVVTHPPSETLNLAANCLDETGYGEYWDACSRSISIPITATQVFTAQTYPSFNTITVKFPLYDNIVQVLPSTLVQSWTKTTNTTDYILTFTMVPSSSHITGVVSTLQLGAETGTVSTYTIGIN